METPKTIQVIAIVLGHPPDLMADPIAEGTMHNDHRTCRNQAGTKQESSVMLASFIVLESATSAAGGKCHQQSYPAKTPVNYNNGLHANMSMGTIMT